MKKRLMALVVGASFSAVSVPASALAPTADDGSATANVEFCKQFSAGSGIPVGRCVGFVQTEELGSAGFATHFCQAFEGSDPEEFYLIYDSYNECVRELHTQP